MEITPHGWRVIGTCRRASAKETIAPNLTNPSHKTAKKKKKKAAHQSVLGNSMPFRPVRLHLIRGLKGGNTSPSHMYWKMHWFHVYFKRRKKKARFLCCQCHLSILYHQTSDTFKSLFLANIVDSNLVWLRMYSVIFACRGSSQKKKKKKKKFSLQFVSIHFCLKDTRWHNQIKLEFCFIRSIICQERCTFFPPCTTQATSAGLESHTSLIILELPPL